MFLHTHIELITFTANFYVYWKVSTTLHTIASSNRGELRKSHFVRMRVARVISPIRFLRVPDVVIQDGADLCIEDLLKYVARDLRVCPIVLVVACHDCHSRLMKVSSHCYCRWQDVPFRSVKKDWFGRLNDWS